MLKLKFKSYIESNHRLLFTNFCCTSLIPTIEFDVRLPKIICVKDVLNIDMEIWTTVKPIKIYLQVVTRAFVCLDQIYTPWKGMM